MNINTQVWVSKPDISKKKKLKKKIQSYTENSIMHKEQVNYKHSPPFYFIIALKKIVIYSIS